MQEQTGKFKQEPFDVNTHPMQTRSHSHSLQIAQHILESDGTSDWLRSNLKRAILRDPVDALRDAEMLATALRVRCLQTFSDCAPLSAGLTATVLQQHADSLGQIAKDLVKGLDSKNAFRIKAEISGTVLQLHDTARNLLAAGVQGGARMSLNEVTQWGRSAPGHAKPSPPT